MYHESGGHLSSGTSQSLQCICCGCLPVALLIQGMLSKMLPGQSSLETPARTYFKYLIFVCQRNQIYQNIFLLILSGLLSTVNKKKKKTFLKRGSFICFCFLFHRVRQNNEYQWINLLIRHVRNRLIIFDAVGCISNMTFLCQAMYIFTELQYQTKAAH